MPKIISVILTCFMAVFLIFAPMLFSHTHDNLYTVKEAKKKEEYQGIMTLWTVSDDAFLAGKVTDEVIKKAEKEKVRVYIEKENITVTEAKSRLEAGIKPDMICFEGLSPVSFEVLLPMLQKENTVPSLKNAGIYGENLYAVPYMCAAVINEDTAYIKAYYFCALKSGDILKNDMMTYIADVFSSENTQKSIAQKDFVPCYEYTGLFETENDTSAIYDMLFGELYIKNVFA